MASAEQPIVAPVQAESDVPVAHSTFVPPPPMPVVHAVEAEPELVEVVKEYEPEEASASFRIDPTPPREFRQAAPVEEPVEPEAIEEVHEMTSIHADGVMESAPTASEAEVDAEPTVGGYHATVPTFEPGMGVLEEELLEDDEEPLVLSSVEARGRVEPDSLDESLVDAPDLGLMLEDISLDQLTGAKRLRDDDEDDDEDFEEDLLEEDQDLGGTDDLDEEDEDGEEDALDEAEGEDEGVVAEGGAISARPAEGQREPQRDRDRGRDGRGRDGRDGRGRSRDRGRSSSSGGRERSSGGRDGGGRDGGRGRQTAQATNLPAISDLLKPGQEILVQIAKEPIAKKGARITSHIALPGRFLVFMPTVSHTGVSRKIESDAERRRLKEILLSERGEAQGGFIVRTAASGASEEELRSDLRFLLNLWSDIKTRSESSKSPALIYHDLNLIERVLRDQVTDNFSAIWVDSETEYERVLRFLQRFQPSLIRRVKLYTKETPLFEQFGITEEINKALRSKVWLKSGGSIVINQTEALVAIDINTGKFVGKTARLEDTIVKTNLDAIPEIVRQIRLRDLGGIIIIDFIDMDERRNRNKVMQALEDELKLDRAPSKVLQFNDFGLVAITRKRVKQSLERTLSTTCGVCQGTGMVKSPVTVCNDIYVEMKKMAKHLDRGDVMLRVHPEVVKALKAPSTHWLQELEEMCGKTVLVKSDPSLHPEQFDIH
jgi:ribonuclease G